MFFENKEPSLYVGAGAAGGKVIFPEWTLSGLSSGLVERSHHI